MKPTRTWILIADGARARILENLGPGKGVHEVPDMTFAGDHEMSHDLGSDQPGRSFESVGGARHPLTPRTDPHRELKRTFAETLAHALADSLDKHGYDRLILVAPAVTLGDLRHCLSSHVKDRVTGELTEDLTKMPDARVAEHLGKVMAV